MLPFMKERKNLVKKKYEEKESGRDEIERKESRTGFIVSNNNFIARETGKHFFLLEIFQYLEEEQTLESNE